ncbi:hypothetical protein CPB86DRAFT_791715 [Serendipita vermifera]|nr:hypothetical protein CPB86DRAFT_791715 [Serendipita vermifera]
MVVLRLFSSYLYRAGAFFHNIRIAGPLFISLPAVLTLDQHMDKLKLASMDQLIRR